MQFLFNFVILSQFYLLNPLWNGKIWNRSHSNPVSCNEALFFLHACSCLNLYRCSLRHFLCVGDDVCNDSFQERFWEPLICLHEKVSQDVKRLLCHLISTSQFSLNMNNYGWLKYSFHHRSFPVLLRSASAILPRPRNLVRIKGKCVSNVL